MDKQLTEGERMQVDTAPQDLAHGQEVGQHRFTMFTKTENYAYARGLEISPAHLPRALDAMLVDGWELVSLFGQTDAKHVGFIFRWVGPNKRVDELLAANNREIARRRTADNLLKDFLALHSKGKLHGNGEGSLSRGVAMYLDNPYGE